MKKSDGKKLDQIITMIGDVVETFGKRFDKIDGRFNKLDDEVAAVKSKVIGTNRRLDTEALQRSDLKLPRRVHRLEEKVFGRGSSQHPKELPF